MNTLRKVLIIFALLAAFWEWISGQEFKVVPKARFEVAIDKSGYRVSPEAGGQNMGGLLQPNMDVDLGRMRTDIAIDLIYRQFTLEFENKCWIGGTKEAAKNWGFNPSQIVFNVTLQYKLKSLPQGKAYIKHACYHPVKGQRSELNYGFFGGITSVGVSWNY